MGTLLSKISSDEDSLLDVKLLGLLNHEEVIPVEQYGSVNKTGPAGHGSTCVFGEDGTIGH